MSNITFVTALLDIKRENLQSNSFKRSFERYLETLSSLLHHLKDKNLVIYIEPQHNSFVKQYKSDKIVFKELTHEQLRKTEYFDKIQKIRTNESWKNQAGWLSESTQACLEFYNPLIFQKMHYLNEAAEANPFDTEYFLWVDAGIANAQCHPGYFSKPWFEERIIQKLQKFLFLCFPYTGNTEIHGFERNGMNKFANVDFIDRVARATLFGGNKSDVEFFTEQYNKIAHETLDAGYMGTEESIFTILTYLFRKRINVEMISGNGLISSFLEKLQNQDNIILGKSALYVITYNSPKQFETLLNSIELYDKDLLDKTTKFLLDNSSDASTFDQYSELCKNYNFEHIKKDNLGICGGRQFIAEHFHATNLEYMLFFEDDMFFYPHEGKVCKNGFARYTKNLYNKIMKIMSKESYDFLKLSFTEFFGDNSTQWSWYNVPQNKREEFWPDYCKLPEQGLDPNSPKTVFNNIKSLDGLPYADGEVYYCNWPQIVSKEGNEKMFLQTKWAHPYEQTWMSHIYQKTKAGEINPGLLLLTPIEHNRFDHYPANERKES